MEYKVASVAVLAHCLCIASKVSPVKSNHLYLCFWCGIEQTVKLRMNEPKKRKRKQVEPKRAQKQNTPNCFGPIRNVGVVRFEKRLSPNERNAETKETTKLVYT